jgi:hypothetical protein
MTNRTSTKGGSRACGARFLDPYTGEPHYCGRASHGGTGVHRDLQVASSRRAMLRTMPGRPGYYVNAAGRTFYVAQEGVRAQARSWFVREYVGRASLATLGSSSTLEGALALVQSFVSA